MTIGDGCSVGYCSGKQRIARMVAPDLPHCLTQRGNRRMQAFFGDDDHRAYLALLASLVMDGSERRAGGDPTWVHGPACRLKKTLMRRTSSAARRGVELAAVRDSDGVSSRFRS